MCSFHLLLEVYFPSKYYVVFVSHIKTSAMAEIFACIEFQLFSQHSGRSGAYLCIILCYTRDKIFLWLCDDNELKQVFLSFCLKTRFNIKTSQIGVAKVKLDSRAQISSPFCIKNLQEVLKRFSSKVFCANVWKWKEINEGRYIIGLICRVVVFV